MGILIGGVLVVGLAALFIFGGGKLTTLLKGFVGVFIEDLTKTPEGAAAVYNQAIEKSQEQYNIANDTLQKVAGELDTALRALKDFEKRLTDCETSCENFAKAGQFDKVELFAQEREVIIDDIENQKAIIAELKPLYEEAKVINNHLEDKLVKLKKEKNRVITDMKRNSQLKSMYDDMDELKNTTNVDKLLDTVKTGVQQSREKAVGARTVHNNKTSTKVSAAKEEAKKLQSNDYIEQLKKKHNYTK
ncbi:gp247 [Bacillus phage G]|uniref:Gp247 n=1 Tax=Bacillus phage G TaxID=2884420 RepID=G3M9Y8_9CAUD|nr:gp247 [Bacillus phage G]AEO93506.1 gp247 [Bacillus phage G]